MENLEQYIARTRGFMLASLPREGGFETDPGLEEKVNGRGELRPFFGDTVVFQAEEELKEWAGKQQELLYRACGELLAEPLKKEFFHVTLHDLSSQSLCPGLFYEMEKNRKKAEEFLEAIRKEGRRPLSIRAVSLFNMVNTSVVLGFAPSDEASLRRLMELYERFQEVVKLPYPLTIHMTLAYYRPGSYPETDRIRLSRAFTGVGEAMGREFFLDERRLFYQRFKSMNEYCCV